MKTCFRYDGKQLAVHGGLHLPLIYPAGGSTRVPAQPAASLSEHLNSNIRQI